MPRRLRDGGEGNGAVERQPGSRSLATAFYPSLPSGKRTAVSEDRRSTGKALHIGSGIADAPGSRSVLNWIEPPLALVTPNVHLTYPR